MEKKTGNRRKYVFLNHTADAMMRVCGKNLKGLLGHGAEGVISYIYGRGNAGRGIVKTIRAVLPAADEETVLVRFLNEVLYQAQEKGLAYRGIESVKKYGGKVAVRFRAIRRDKKRSAEVKAVTYHKLQIKKTKSGMSASVILDV
ncbi:MAG: archease [Endomicrobiales bacterium]|nr:archease [Endomicrobiales bacterium]